MKKILIIAYYWPPAGGPGVQRWLKFVKYLPEFGYSPIVYVPDNPTYPIIDESLLNEVPQNAVILRKKIFEPYGLASIFSKKKVNKISSGIIPAKQKQSLSEKLALWIRGNLFIPDARVLWVKPSVAFLKDYIKDNEISTVITTGPPHSMHLIGIGLKELTGVRWIADFRDPWTTIGYHKLLRLSKYAKMRHKILERQVLKAADEIIVTSNSTKKEFETYTQKPVTIITNGYDIKPNPIFKLDDKFTISHIGSLLAGRNPKILWESLSELKNEVLDFTSSFQLKLIGAVSEEIVDSIRSHNLLENTNLVGYVSHPEAVSHQQQSQVLLLIEVDTDETKSIIPGKLFEYIVSGRPIIAIGPDKADFSEIIAEANSGIFITYSEKEKLKQAIFDYYKAYLNGSLRSEVKSIEKYSRRNLTSELANLLSKGWE